MPLVAATKRQFKTMDPVATSKDIPNVEGARSLAHTTGEILENIASEPSVGGDVTPGVSLENATRKILLHAPPLWTSGRKCLESK